MCHFSLFQMFCLRHQHNNNLYNAQPIITRNMGPKSDNANFLVGFCFANGRFFFFYLPLERVLFSVKQLKTSQTLSVLLCKLALLIHQMLLASKIQHSHYATNIFVLNEFVYQIRRIKKKRTSFQRFVFFLFTIFFFCSSLFGLFVWNSNIKKSNRLFFGG